MEDHMDQKSNKNHARGIKHRYIVLGAILLMMVVGSCEEPESSSSAPSTPTPPQPQPTVFSLEELYKQEEKLVVLFSAPLASYEGSKIVVNKTVKGGTATKLALTKDYTLKLEGKTIEITFTKKVAKDETYEVQIQAEGVKSTAGKTNEQAEQKQVTINKEPELERGLWYIEPTEGKKIIITFNEEVKVLDASKIKVQKQGADGYAEVEVASVVVKEADKSQLEIELQVAAKAQEKYKVLIEKGGIKGATEGNATKWETGEIEYQQNPLQEQAVYIVGKKITVEFGIALKSIEATKLQVKKKNGANYDELSVSELPDINKQINEEHKKRLELELVQNTQQGEVYRIDFAAGALTAISNQQSVQIAPIDKDIEINGGPVLDSNKDPYIVGKEITVVFDKDLVLLDASKIKVLKQAVGGSSFSELNATALPEANKGVKESNKKQLALTIVGTVQTGEKYRIKLEAGAVRDSDEGNAEIAPIDKDIEIEEKPELSPEGLYIVGREITVSFAGAISLLDARKVKVLKQARGASNFTEVSVSSVALDSNDTTKLKVTVPATQTGEKYRIKLEAGAVENGNKKANEELFPTDRDIEITGGPVLDSSKDPYIVGKEIRVTFDKNVSILDASKIKVLKQAVGGSSFSELNATALPEANKVLNGSNKKQLELTLVGTVQTGETYRIKLEAGAVKDAGEGNRTIEPTTKDILITGGPVLDSNKAPYIVGKEITVMFDRNVEILDKSKIQVLKQAVGGSRFSALNASTLPAANKVLNGSNKKQLALTIVGTVQTGETYRIKLEAGAVKDSDEGNTEIAPDNKDIAITGGPVLDSNKAPYIVSKVITVSFDRNVEILDKSKIQVLKKASGGSTFSALNTSTLPEANKVLNRSNKKQLELTLVGAVQTGETYRIKLEAGAVKDSDEGNAELAPDNKDIVITGNPVLNNSIPPYIVGTVIRVTFDRVVSIEAKSKIKIKKKARGAADFTELTVSGSNKALDTDKKILKITVPSTTTGDTYRLELEAGAVSANGRDNEAIAPTDKDIVITGGPVLDSSKNPYIVGKKIQVFFTKAIAFLDKSKIQVLKQASGSVNFVALNATALPAANKVINSNDNKQLELTIVGTVQTGDTYRIKLEAGAVKDASEGNAELAPTTKDIVITGGPVLAGNVTLASKVLTVTFDRTITIVSKKKIKVLKKTTSEVAYKEVSVSELPEANKTRASGNDRQLKLTLVGNVRDNDKYRIKLEAGAVKDSDEGNTEIAPTDKDVAVTGGAVLDGSNDMYVVGKEFIIPLDKVVSIEDKSKIILKKQVSGGSTFVDLTDSELPAANKGLVSSNNALKLTVAQTPTKGDTYRIKLEAGAVKVSGDILNDTIVPPTNKDIVITGGPGLDSSEDPYIVGAVITVTFDSNITIMDKDKIKVQKKASGGTFTELDDTAVPDNSIVKDTNNAKVLKITVPTPNKNDTYRLEFEAGALFSENEGNRTIAPTDKDIEITGGAVLDSNKAPYIVGTVITVTFDKNIAFLDKSKIKVKKKAAGGGTFTDVVVSGSNIVKDTNDEKVLKITVPTPKDKETYRLAFEEGALLSGNEGNGAINKDIEIIGAVLDSNKAPYIAGTVIVVTFDKNIAFLDKSKIKVKKKASGGSSYTTLVVLGSNIVKDTNNAKVLKITVPSTTTGDMYRIELEAGALFSENGVSGAIAPTDKDITIGAGPVLGKGTKPQITKKNVLDVSFLVNVELIAPDSIVVYKKAKGGIFSPLGASDRTIAVDSTDKKKIQITPKNTIAKEETWKVVFPAGTVLGVASRNGNSGRQETGEYTTDTGDVSAWEQLSTSNPIWSKRSRHATVMFKNKIWVLGGDDNEVWSSADGKAWKKHDTSKSKPMWDERVDHGAVVFKDKIWILGNGSFFNLKNEVWSSADGEIWTKHDTSKSKSMWDERGTMATVFKNRIWILGGTESTGDSVDGDVWSSADGEIWTEHTIKDSTNDATKLWSVIGDGDVVVFNNKMWVLGGDEKVKGYDSLINGVWSSADGEVWERHDTSKSKPMWSTRSDHSAAVFDNKIWIFGGAQSNNINISYLNDVWSSTDGNTWKQQNTITSDGTAIWGKRSNFSVVKLKNKIFLLGGWTGKSTLGDVWTFPN